MAELKVISRKPWATKLAGGGMMSCSSTPTRCSSLCTVVGPMTVWSAASNSISGLICSFWMISGSSLFRPLAPATCMISSMNGTNEAACCLRPTVPQRNGQAYSAIPSWPQPASTGSVTGPKSSLFEGTASGRRAAPGSNRRWQ